ncbi:MAG TPA: 30S ribosomal protein S6 [Dehalococcoidia bacterium]|nr:30S ribosomal protein S6 [Dehalococcoidia bacterium]
MAREYEMVVILSPETTEDDVPQRLEGLKDLVTTHGGNVTESIDWGRRRLAYQIKGNFEGHYLITEFTADTGTGNVAIERDLNIDETVLRYLIVRKDD